MVVRFRTAVVSLLAAGVALDGATSLVWFAKWWGKVRTPLDSNQVILWLSKSVGVLAPAAYLPIEASLFVMLPWLLMKRTRDRPAAAFFCYFCAGLLYGAAVHNLLLLV